MPKAYTLEESNIYITKKYTFLVSSKIVDVLDLQENDIIALMPKYSQNIIKIMNIEPEFQDHFMFTATIRAYGRNKVGRRFSCFDLIKDLRINPGSLTFVCATSNDPTIVSVSYNELLPGPALYS